MSDAAPTGTPTPSPIDIRPKLHEPPESLAAPARRALPAVLNDAPFNGEAADYLTLRQRLEAKGHGRDAAEWAIHWHVEAGHLVVEPGYTAAPGVLNSGRWVVGGGGSTRSRQRDDCRLRATPALWAWRNSEYAPYFPADGENPYYTLRSVLCELWHFAFKTSGGQGADRKQIAAVMAAWEPCESLARCRSPQWGITFEVFDPILSRARQQAHALFRVAAQFSNAPLHEVDSDYHALMERLLQLGDSAASYLPPPQPYPPTDPHRSAPPANVEGEPRGNAGGKRTGRRRLRQKANASEKERALHNAYELVRAALQPGWGPQALVTHFKDDKDFKQLVRNAGRTPNKQFMRAALDWIKRNQKTQSGNVL